MKELLTSSASAILGLLTWHPMSGYDIKANTERSIGNFWSESFGQLYPQLKALNGCGAIKEIDPLPDGDKPKSKRPKKVYEITELGREILRKWLEKEPTTRPLREEFLLKIFFASSGDINTIRDHCIKARYEAQARQKNYQAIAKEIEDMASHKPDAFFWKMTVDFGLESTKAYMMWCDDTLAKLETYKPAQASDKQATNIETRGNIEI